MTAAPIDFSDRTTVAPTTAVGGRMLACLRNQAARNTRCPASPRLAGWNALVTGGGRGIGWATSRGLADRGVDVWMTSRGKTAGEEAARTLSRASGTKARFQAIDLADLRSVRAGLDALEERLAGETLDLFVANAGLWPTRYAASPQGHEIAFATNVLGHHALLVGLIDRNLLAEHARVIFVTGDIYIMSDACSKDYGYRTPLGGQLAYCRSKLGNLWQAFEFARRFPALRVHAVHPGVIASELSGTNTGAVGWVKRKMMLSTEAGAQTTLFCATQPGLESGTYYHNVLGRMQLHADDPAADRGAAEALWEELDALTQEGKG